MPSIFEMGSGDSVYECTSGRTTRIWLDWAIWHDRSIVRSNSDVNDQSTTSQENKSQDDVEKARSSHLVCHRLITAPGRKQIGMWVVFSHPENRARHWRSFRANQHQIIGVGSVSWQCPKVTCKEVILETGSNFLCKRSRMPMMHVAIGAEVSNLAVSLLVRRLRLVKWYANYPVSLETRRTIQPMHSVGLAIVGQHWARWSIRSVTLRECMLRRLTSQNALHPSMPITPPLFQHLVHLDNPIDRSAIFPHWGLGASQ